MVKQNLQKLSNRCYSFISHVSPARSPPPLVADTGQLQLELKMLETPTSVEISSMIMSNAEAARAIFILDKILAALGLNEATPLDHGSVASKTSNNIPSKRVPRNTIRSRRTKRLLWHGNRFTNFDGTLSQSLRIAAPEAPVPG